MAIIHLGVHRFCADIERMSGYSPGLYWRICWSYISPTMLLVSGTASPTKHLSITTNHPSITTNHPSITTKYPSITIVQLPL